jgi:hypothetical protein
MWLIQINVAPTVKELKAESPFTSMAVNFTAFPARIWFCDL